MEQFHGKQKDGNRQAAGRPFRCPGDLHFCTKTPRMRIAGHSTPAYSFRISREALAEAAPNGVTSTVGRLHKRHRERTAPMIHNSHAKEGGSPARTLPPSTWTTDDSLRFELREHVRKLRLILPIISVSIMALHRQIAELDYDIDSVLSEHACGLLPFDYCPGSGKREHR
jgi:hypothetical protein